MQLCLHVCVSVCEGLKERTRHPFYYLEVQEGQGADKSLLDTERLGRLYEQKAPKNTFEEHINLFWNKR